MLKCNAGLRVLPGYRLGGVKSIFALPPADAKHTSIERPYARMIDEQIKAVS
jgi:hypothetical protein